MTWTTSDEPAIPLPGRSDAPGWSRDDSIRPYIVGGALVGLVIALLGVGIVSLLQHATAEPRLESPQGGTGDLAKSSSSHPQLMIRTIQPAEVGPGLNPRHDSSSRRAGGMVGARPGPAHSIPQEGAQDE